MRVKKVINNNLLCIVDEKGYELIVSGKGIGFKRKIGELLISFDMDGIKAAGYLCTTPMIVCNTDDYKSIKPLVTGEVKAGQNLLAVIG